VTEKTLSRSETWLWVALRAKKIFRLMLTGINILCIHNRAKGCIKLIKGNSKHI